MAGRAKMEIPRGEDGRIAHIHIANSAQMKTLILARTILSVLDKGAPAMQDLLSGVPGAWRMYRSSMEILRGALMRTGALLEPQQWKQVDRTMRNSVFRLHATQVRSDKDMVVGVDDILTVLRAAQRGDCEMCIKTDCEIAKCELRKAFYAISTADRVPPHGCWFRGDGVKGDK